MYALTPNTLGGFIYTRSEYNAKGQLTKQYQDTGSNTATTAPTLYEYDAFGNMVKQTLALAATPTKDNSPITELSYSVESTAEGVFSVTTNTRYNAEGNPLTSAQKLLISRLSNVVESKNLTIDERNLTSTQWVEYHVGTKRKSYNTLPTSDITAEAVTVDGFTLSQTDNSGVTATHSRSYTATGMIQTRTDGRGNTATTVTDKTGRPLTVTDAAGNATTTAYDSAHDLPATVTDAQGNTSCYRYDVRGRKLAEWGTGIQPVCFVYDDADRMVTLTTFRASAETVSSDSSDRTDGDVTIWSYHDASGMEISKTYADNTSVVKTYDAYNRVLTETDARGKVKAHTYEHARGLLLGTTYSDSTTARAYIYNHLGQPTQVTDAAGVRTLSYNAYGEQKSDSLLADNVTHLITETRDDKGRSTGYTYAKNGTVQQTVTTGYGSDGRIASAGFLHGGAEKQFSYEYMSGTHLLEKLTMPNNMMLTQSYEIQRDLLTGMAYHRGTTLVANRQYSYDTLGRPTARNTSRQGAVKNDTFGYNNRSELTSATVNGSNYAYDYDNIGNRETATESEITTTYTANELNQYTAIGDFTPTFDADGNQTLVKTSTGTWFVTYDAENRPVNFTNAESSTVVECSYDYKGRRATKKVTVNGSVTLHQRFLYRGYLQIACCDLTRSNHPCLWLITWDPTQPIATRPLAIQKDGTWYTYGWDLTKNICELYGSNGYIRTSYTYSPYGSVTESSNRVYQPIKWSSEYNDTELSLVYYNYRHYNPMDGRWLGRDKFPIWRYVFLVNTPTIRIDMLGLYHKNPNRINCIGFCNDGNCSLQPGSDSLRQTLEQEGWDCSAASDWLACPGNLENEDVMAVFINIYEVNLPIKIESVSYRLVYDIYGDYVEIEEKIAYYKMKNYTHDTTSKVEFVNAINKTLSYLNIMQPLFDAPNIWNWGNASQEIPLVSLASLNDNLRIEQLMRLDYHGVLKQKDAEGEYWEFVSHDQAKTPNENPGYKTYRVNDLSYFISNATFERYNCKRSKCKL